MLGLQKMTNRLGGRSADGDQAGLELTDDSELPYEQLGEQTEAVNQLYEHIEANNGVKLDGATTGVDPNDNALDVNAMPGDFTEA